MKLKLILQHKVNNSFIKELNYIIDRLGHKTVDDVWLNIQHLDMFFNDEGVTASYQKVHKIIDFRDEDGTVIFYVTN